MVNWIQEWLSLFVVHPCDHMADWELLPRIMGEYHHILIARGKTQIQNSEYGFC